MNADQALLAKLRRLWQRQDPVAPDLADRVLFALQLEDLEFELLSLRATPQADGARTTEQARSVTFGSDSLTVMIKLSEADLHQYRIDGWIVPGAALRVEVRTSRGTRETVAEPTGRFSLTGVPAGLVQLVIHPTDGAVLPLARPVVTPALRL